jgi:hypothetical protein
LILKEFLGVGNILARAAQTAFGKDGQQSLNHPLGDIGIGVLIADGVKIFAVTALQADRLGQVVIERFLLLAAFWRANPDRSCARLFPGWGGWPSVRVTIAICCPVLGCTASPDIRGRNRDCVST